jgi:hypothetical protein
MEKQVVMITGASIRLEPQLLPNRLRFRAGLCGDAVGRSGVLVGAPVQTSAQGRAHRLHAVAHLPQLFA